MSEKSAEEKRNAQWDLTEGHLYKIRSRNLSSGVYDGKGGFTGIRQKFGSRYLFTEYDWDNGPPFGTVVVKEDLGPVPEGIEISEGTWSGSGDAAEWESNSALFGYLDGIGDE